MGVQGLWQLLQPTGRPVSLQSLEGKVLAVDVSIWLHQAVKGMRDKSGNPLPNAHLHVLFTRVCKLLYYKIKPVFVFDGSVPELKKQTMASRRERKMVAEVEGDKASKKLLDNLLKSHALKEVLNKGHASTAGNSNVSQPSTSTQPSTSSQSQETAEKRDLFQLPPPPEEFVRAQELQPWEEVTSNATIFQDEFQNLDDVDIDSPEFKSLPSEIQHEILSELKERRKRLTRYTNLVLPEDSNDFSSFQMKKILKQSHLSNKIEEVRKEMNSQVSGAITEDLGEHTLGTEIQTRRILSDDNSHFILIKGLTNKRKMEEINRIQEETEMAEEMEEESISGVEGKEERPENYKDDLVESDTEICDHGMDREKFPEGGGNIECQVQKNNENGIKDEKSSVKSADKSVKNEGVIDISDSDEENNETDNIISRRQMEVSKSKNKTSQSHIKSQEITTAEFNKVSSTSITLNVDRSQLSVEKESEERKPNENESSDSEDEGFIEVSIDPQNVGPDELFPADIFTTTSKPDLISVPDVESQKQIVPEVEPHKELVSEVEPQYSREPEHIEAESETIESSPEATRDLVKQFTELVENDVNRLSEELELESRSLQQERGRQERLATSLSDQMFLEAQDLLRLFGVPYVLSPTEAEAQCAWLDSINLTHGTITDDSDIWLFGGRRVYKNFFNQDRTVEFYQKESIQSQLGLSRAILINMALLCGSDYTDGIPGVGPVTAMEILSEFPASDISSLQAFKSWWEESQKKKRNPNVSKVRSKLRQLEVNEGFPDHRIVDAYLKPTVDDSEEAFSWVLPDLDLLREYAKEKLGWTKVKTDEVLLPVLQKLKDSQTQTRINSFFQPENFMEPKKLKSVRLKRALKKFHDSPEKQTETKVVSDSESKRKDNEHGKTKRMKVTNDQSTKKSKGVSNSHMRPARGKGSKSVQGRGRGKGKGPAKKTQITKRPVYKDEVNLSESSSDDQNDDMDDDNDDDDLLANLDYESWQK
ncbi:DNA excision repair protein ERCC-5 homolog [Saccostrea echinata]|uniref:DNA excision repair protein ERCC-5 homolog n=1 Tax=Saccostrea echinata TaxID=191078 RepID=UPI002A827B2E|nr:DNA excision repair protein ERCC-5 homolog [Saccostrea echinata]